MGLLQWFHAKKNSDAVITLAGHAGAAPQGEVASDDGGKDGASFRKIPDPVSPGRAMADGVVADCAQQEGEIPDHVVEVTLECIEPSPDFERAVDDAMWLLMYAAEKGHKVDDATRTSVLRARAMGSKPDEATFANLLVALTTLAADCSPVTADSLRASRDRQAKPTISSLRKFTFALALPIILFSLLGFVTSSLSTTLRADITKPTNCW